MVITKREILASITIIAIMLLLGVVFSGKISEWQMDSNEKYNKAIKVETTEVFKYGMKTNAGNAFVYGELEAVDPVSLPEIKGEYLSLEKVEERYTKHHRTVTTRDSDGKTKTHIETYWTWDRVGSEELRAKKVKFCNVEFNTSQFSALYGNYIDTLGGGFSHTRFKYYGSPAKSEGTIFTDLANKNIAKENVPFYKDMTIEQTMDSLDSNAGVIIFWIFWILLICGVVYGFYYLENDWLESRK